MENITESGQLMKNNDRPETIVIINCILNAPLMLISIIGNSLVLAAILRTPTLHSPSIMFLCSLAVSDLFVGLVLQPLYIAYELTKLSSLYQPMTTIAVTGVGVSLGTITVISLDRFLALHYHMRYQNMVTMHRAKYTIATLWLLNFLVSFFAFWKITYYYFVIAVSIPIHLLLSTVCYVRIYRIVRRHQLQILAQQHAVGNLNDESNMQPSAKSAKNTFIYYIVMILCYTPLFISMTILFFFYDRWTVAWNLTDTVAFMNSSINPFLYCWRLRELRTAVIKTAKKMLCKRTEENFPS
ncbi:melanocyte-stimulating hormone receptor-like [Oculina patagonica]